MDPATAYAIVSGSAGLIVKCAGIVQSLNSIAGKYKNAKLEILSMSQSLETIRMAWEQICSWVEQYAITLENSTTVPPDAKDEEVFLGRLKRSLEVGTMIICAFEEQLLPYKACEDSVIYQSSKTVWNEGILKDHQERISHQAVAMTCLMQAVQMKSSIDRKAKLQDAGPDLRRSEESACSAYSIVPSRMSVSTYNSFTSNGSADLIYSPLSCEDELFAAKVYKRNYRTPLIRQLFKSRRTIERPALCDARGQLRFQDNISPKWVIKLRALKMARLETSPVPTPQISFAFECEHKHAIRDNMEATLDNDELAFLEACSWGEADWVEEILQERLSEPKGPRFLTPLQALRAISEAVIFRNLNVLKVLQANGACIGAEIASVRCWQPMQWAAYNGDASMVKALLEANISVYKGHTGSHPLHIASHIGSLEVTSVLLDAGVAVDTSDLWGLQSIHYASQYHNRAKQLRLLVKHGADIEAVALLTNMPARPLRQARYTSQYENVQTLISLGAKDEEVAVI